MRDGESLLDCAVPARWATQTIGVAHPFTFLAGPLAILALVAWRRTRRAAGRERMLPAALCLGLLSVTVPMMTGTVLLVQVFAIISATGAGGSRAVADALINASHPMFYGLLTVALCGAVAAWLVLRPGATVPTTHRIRWGAAAGVVAVPASSCSICCFGSTTP